MSQPNWTRRSFATLIALSAATGGRNSWGGQWNCWRGPDRDGHTPSALPRTLSSLRELWSVSLGDSYSGPLVTDQYVYVTETLEGKFETLRAFQRTDGKELWNQQWEGSLSVPFFAKSNGDWIRSTPATNGEVVVAAGMRDMLQCVDAKTGAQRWFVDFNQKFGVDPPAFGLVCSPLIDDQQIYIQAGGGVRKLSLASGETIWKCLEEQGGMYGGAFSSPIIAELDGQRQLVVQTRSALAGVDLETGAVLWQQEIASFRGMNILTPVVWQNHVYTSCYGGRSQLFKVARASDGSWSAKPVWEGKAEAYMSSPVRIGDHLYLHLRNQRLCCIRLSDGVETWRTTPFGKYWSMVTDGQTILGLDERGILYVVQPNPEKFELLDEKAVSSEPAWAHLAVADGQIFVRHLKGLQVFA